jgi:hypothetical protein
MKLDIFNKFILNIKFISIVENVISQSFNIIFICTWGRTICFPFQLFSLFESIENIFPFSFSLF